MSDTQTVQITVTDVIELQKARLMALADVELNLDGVCLLLHGVKVSRITLAGGQEGALVELPTYRAPDGQWRAALTVPEELKKPIADAVLERCGELGVIKPARFVAMRDGLAS